MQEIENHKLRFNRNELWSFDFDNRHRSHNPPYSTHGIHSPDLGRFPNQHRLESFHLLEDFIKYSRTMSLVSKQEIKPDLMCFQLKLSQESYHRRHTWLLHHLHHDFWRTFLWKNNQIRNKIKKKFNEQEVNNLLHRRGWIIQLATLIGSNSHEDKSIRPVREEVSSK